MRFFAALRNRLRKAPPPATPQRLAALYDDTVKWYGGTVANFQNDPSRIEIGSNSVIEGQLIINPYGGRIKIGSDSYVGYNSRIQSDTSITIGNNVLISYNVNIIDNNAHEINHLERLETAKIILREGFHKVTDRGNIAGKEIFIEDHAWISLNVIILKGVRIGKGAIIGAGSVVTKDIPPFTLAAGNPAVVVKNLEQ